jgi:integrase
MTELILFAIFSGRREAEICRLLWDDLDEQEQTIVVRDAKSPKGSKGNHINTHLTDRAMAIIQRQPRVTGEPRIFPYNPNTVANNFSRTTKRLGLDHLKFHTLRHECASHLMEIGYDIQRVSLVTGHRSWRNLQRYAHLAQLKRKDKYAGWSWAADLPAALPEQPTAEVIPLDQYRHQENR